MSKSIYRLCYIRSFHPVIRAVRYITFNIFFYLRDILQQYRFIFQESSLERIILCSLIIQFTPMCKAFQICQSHIHFLISRIRTAQYAEYSTTIRQLIIWNHSKNWHLVYLTPLTRTICLSLLFPDILQTNRP